MERLVVVDISPAPTAALTNFPAYIQAMKDVSVPKDVPRSTARRLAEDQLRNHVKVSQEKSYIFYVLYGRICYGAAYCTFS